MDIFTEQTIPETLDSYKVYDIYVIHVLADLTKYYQPLDLTVNREAKRFLKRKFVDWYSCQVSNQLSDGKSLESVQVPVKLSIIKPIHPGWLVQFHNYMISAGEKKFIYSGWRAPGITDAVQMGQANLLPIDPFNDYNPLLPLTQETQEFDSVIATPEEQNGLRSSSDEEYDGSSNDDLE